MQWRYDLQHSKRLVYICSQDERKAKATLARPSHSVTAEELQLWRDKAEALGSQINFLNSQIVTTKVELMKFADPIKKSVFTRHRVNRLDHSRALILHLMDQVSGKTPNS